MAPKCRRDQLCWIDVPRTAITKALGIDQIHGHVVRTKSLHPRMSVVDPQWVVEPPQVCRVPRDVVRGDRTRVAAGTVFRFEAVPDSYLRPFEDLPPELFEQQQRVLKEMGS